MTNLVNVRYLTGFTGTNGACIVTPEERLFVTDFRYAEQAQDQVRGFELVKGERDLLGQLAGRLGGRAGFDDAHVTVRVHRKLLESVAEGVELVEAAGLVERLREIKDEDELRRIAAAAELADEVYELLRERGAAAARRATWPASWSRSCASAARSPPSRRSWRRGRMERCRTPSPGRGDRARDADDRGHGCEAGRLLLGLHADLRDRRRRRRAIEVYDLVLEAQRGPGRRSGRRRLPRRRRSGTRPDRRGRVRRGVRPRPGPRRGLEVHEGPRLAKSAEGDLAAGNVVTVEPGVYLPGELGVRIEDLVVVGDDGLDVLTGFPKELVRPRLMGLAAAAALLGAAVQSATAALILSPALLAVLDPYEAVTALLVLGLALNLLVRFDGGTPGPVRWRELVPVLAAAVPGLVLGAAGWRCSTSRRPDPGGAGGRRRGGGAAWARGRPARAGARRPPPGSRAGR